jgi:hypothetical protein
VAAEALRAKQRAKERDEEERQAKIRDERARMDREREDKLAKRAAERRLNATSNQEPPRTIRAVPVAGPCGFTATLAM